MGNLYASTIVRLRAGDPPPATLALVVAVALIETVLALQPRGSVTLKWPNDLLVDGAKLSGILLEREGDAVVVGIGVNVAAGPALDDRATVSLAAMGVETTPAALLDDLAATLRHWIAVWRDAGVAAIAARWTERAHAPGTPLLVRLSTGEEITGAFDRLDPDGALRLRLADGASRAIHAGDVFLL